jgi:hypothetical protein
MKFRPQADDSSRVEPFDCDMLQLFSLTCLHSLYPAILINTGSKFEQFEYILSLSLAELVVREDTKI